MRFVLLFRDPVERAYSHWAMEHARGFETLNFSQAIRDGRNRMKGNSHRVYSYVERGFYGAQLAVFRESFPQSPMLFLTSNALMDKTPETLARVAELIGVDRTLFPSERFRRRRNPQREMPPADRHYLEDVFADDLREFAVLSGLDLAEWPTAVAVGAV